MWNEVLENLVVVKRSGQRVDFNASKIAIAVKKAFDAVYGDADENQVYSVFEKVLKYINTNYKDRKTINVEDIQDIIENTLKSAEYENVFLAFKDYRQKRAASRKVFNEKQQHKFVKVIERVEEESNSKDLSLTPKELLNKFGKIISSEYAKSYVLDSKYVRALEEGNLYIHNLNYFSLGYLSHVNLKLNVDDNDDYLDEFISEIINAQNEVSEEIGINVLDSLLKRHVINHYKKIIDTYLKKYLKLNGLLEYVGYKKFQDIINKIEDINIDYEIFEPVISNHVLENTFKILLEDVSDDIKVYINDIVYRIFNMLRANVRDNNTYTISIGYDDSKVCAMLRNSIISYLTDNNYINNVHVVFKIKHNYEDYYLTKIASLIINQKNISLAFVDNSYNSQLENSAEYFANGMRIFENTNDNEYKGTGRMIVASTSINLARLGLKYTNKNLKDFYEELDQQLELAKNELLLSFETIGNKNKDNYLALFNGNIQGDERLESGQKIRKIIKTGNLSIGLIGLKECILSLEKDDDKKYDFLIKLLEYFNQKCRLFSEETKLNFNIFEPSDNHSRKYVMGIDKSIYGVTKNITDKNMYDLIQSSKFINDYSKLSKVQSCFKGGLLITIDLPKKANNKQVVDLIKNMIDVDIGFVKMKVDSK